MKPKALKVMCLTLVVLVCGVLVTAAGLNLYKKHGCVIDAGVECTQVIETK